MPDLVTVETVGLRDLAGRFARAQSDWNRVAESEMHMFGRRVLDVARAEAPGRRLPNKLAVEVARTGTDTGLEVKITAEGVDPKILGYIIHGTRPHPISAHLPPWALRFYWKRVRHMVFFRRVNHPGTQPNPFPERALKRVREQGYIRDLARRVGQQMAEVLS